VKNDLVTQMNESRHRRAGITLMEVLIAVGILAVGLSSVVALLPAGHSMAQRSFTTDQASIIAANAAADFVTQGFLRPECLSAAVPPIAYDPLGTTNSNQVTLAGLKPLGLFATSAPAGARPTPLAAYLARGRDDVVFNVPENADQDVTNRFGTDGIREYQGKFTWAALLTRPATSGIPPDIIFQSGDEAVLTIVVFHQRDPSQIFVPLGTYTPGAGALTLPNAGSPLIAGRQNRDLLRTGAVIALEPQAAGSYAVRRLSLASLTTDQSGKETGAFIEFDGGDPFGTTFNAFLIPDAVAVLERLVTIEGPNGYVP
jgi:type II secretory pathway pseudopilin PulG